MALDVAGSVRMSAILSVSTGDAGLPIVNTVRPNSVVLVVLPSLLMRPRTVKKLVEYCYTAWNMDGVPITLGGFAEYRDPQLQTRTEVA